MEKQIVDNILIETYSLRIQLKLPSITFAQDHPYMSAKT